MRKTKREKERKSREEPHSFSDSNNDFLSYHPSSRWISSCFPSTSDGRRVFFCGAVANQKLCDDVEELKKDIGRIIAANVAHD